MTRVLHIKVVATGLEAQADRLEAAAARAALTVAAVDAVNVVTQRADQALRAGEIADISLSDEYVRSKTTVALATRDPRAEITVRGDLTILGRFPLAQITVAAASAKGDPSRGIPAGSKAAGVRAQIKRSSATAQPKWFTMRLRRGARAGDNVGVFVRTGPGSVKHLYGPSPYSLFRYQAGLQLEDIADDLQRTTDQAVADQLTKVL